MSKLTEQQYDEYLRLLRDWVEAGNALDGVEPSDQEAANRTERAYAAVQSFRRKHGLDAHAQPQPSGREAR